MSTTGEGLNYYKPPENLVSGAARVFESTLRAVLWPRSWRRIAG